MKKEDVLQLAKDVIKKEGWPVIEPIVIKRFRLYFIFGPKVWHVMTNANYRGGNINVIIKDKTGEIIGKNYVRH